MAILQINEGMKYKTTNKYKYELAVHPFSPRPSPIIQTIPRAEKEEKVSQIKRLRIPTTYPKKKTALKAKQSRELPTNPPQQ